MFASSREHKSSTTSGQNLLQRCFIILLKRYCLGGIEFLVGSYEHRTLPFPLDRD